MEDSHDLCRLRSTLEAFAAIRLRSASNRDEVMKSLHAHLAKLYECAVRGDYEAFHKVDVKLHREMILSSGMSTLTQSWDLAASALDAVLLGFKKSFWPSLVALYREHVYLMEAWQSDDLSVVEQATHHHLEVGYYRKLISQGGAPPEGGVVDRVASFLSTHYASEIDVEWVARNVGFVSACHLTRRFRAQFGMAPYAWLHNFRMERAAQLLATTRDEVVKVGAMVGYKNASHFTRDFRAKFKVTPKTYRLAALAPQ